MAKAYSLDLRERVIKYIEETEAKEKASELFRVGLATIYRWICRKKEKGNVEALIRKEYEKKIDDEKLKRYIEENRERFLSEIADEFKVTLAGVFYSLKRLKITRKKEYVI